MKKDTEIDFGKNVAFKVGSDMACLFYMQDEEYGSSLLQYQ